MVTKAMRFAAFFRIDGDHDEAVYPFPSQHFHLIIQPSQ